MAKTSSSARSALDAIAVAADAATLAKTAARALPGKDAKKVTALAKDARALASAPEKAVRKNPGKYRRKADAVVGEIVRATAKAIGKADRARTEKPAPAPTPALEVAAPALVVPQRVARRRAAPLTVPPTGLAALTVAELRGRARAAGLRGYSRLRKAQLVALLT